MLVDDAYRPIPCALYSELELAVMHAEVLDVLWREPDGVSRQIAGPAVDLRTRDGGELLLIATGAADAAWLRLDRLVRVTRVRDGARLIGNG